MNENEILDEFFKLFCDSLKNVGTEYFVTTYEEFGYIKSLGGLGTIRDGNFYRYGERIFCYELYHQLRNNFENKKLALNESGIEFMPKVIIQAEVKKIKLRDFVARLGVTALSSNFTPDFLVHTPSNRDFHAFIIEVKVQPSITPEDVWDDIKKIDEFLEVYDYKRGVFLSVNADTKALERIIEKLTEGFEIEERVKNADSGKKEKKMREAKLENLSRYKEIKILAMPEPLQDIFIWSWDKCNWEKYA